MTITSGSPVGRTGQHSCGAWAGDRTIDKVPLAPTVTGGGSEDEGVIYEKFLGGGVEQAQVNNTPLLGKAERMAPRKSTTVRRSRHGASAARMRRQHAAWNAPRATARAKYNAQLGDITSLCLARRGNAKHASCQGALHDAPKPSDTRSILDRPAPDMTDVGDVGYVKRRHLPEKRNGAERWRTACGSLQAA